MKAHIIFGVEGDANPANDPSGCWSHVGRQGGGQVINLGSHGCYNRGTYIHEIMHALGLYHLEVSNTVRIIRLYFQGPPTNTQGRIGMNMWRQWVVERCSRRREWTSMPGGPPLTSSAS